MESQTTDGCKTLDPALASVDPIDCVNILSSSNDIKSLSEKRPKRSRLIDSDEESTSSSQNQCQPKRKIPQILESDEEEECALIKNQIDDTNEVIHNYNDRVPDITKARVSELKIPAKIFDTWQPISSSAIDLVKFVMESNIAKSVSLSRGADKKEIEAVLREAMTQVQESISNTVAPVSNRLEDYTCLMAENIDDNTRMAERKEENTK